MSYRNGNFKPLKTPFAVFLKSLNHVRNPPMVAVLDHLQEQTDYANSNQHAHVTGNMYFQLKNMYSSLQ